MNTLAIGVLIVGGLALTALILGVCLGLLLSKMERIHYGSYKQ